MSKKIGYYDDVTHVPTEVTTVAERYIITDSNGIPAFGTLDTDVFWLILQTAAATSLGGLESVTFLDNIDCGSLSGVGDIPTAGFSTVDLGGMV